MQSVAPARRLWQWVNFVFNRVDHSRVRAVGPDRAAAEWILRLGGAVRFSGLVDSWSKDYNRIPSGELRVQAMDGSGISITNNGLEHLVIEEDYDVGLSIVLEPVELQNLSTFCMERKSITLNGLKHIDLTNLRVLRLSHCKYLGDEGLVYLTNVKHSLKELDLSHCYAITEAGLPSLYCLSSLRKLDLSNTAKSRNRELSLSQLKEQLPNCSIITEGTP